MLIFWRLLKCVVSQLERQQAEELPLTRDSPLWKNSTVPSSTSHHLNSLSLKACLCSTSHPSIHRFFKHAYPVQSQVSKPTKADKSPKYILKILVICLIAVIRQLLIKTQFINVLTLSKSSNIICFQNKPIDCFIFSSSKVCCLGYSYMAKCCLHSCLSLLKNKTSLRLKQIICKIACVPHNYMFLYIYLVYQLLIFGLLWFSPTFTRNTRSRSHWISIRSNIDLIKWIGCWKGETDPHQLQLLCHCNFKILCPHYQ